MKKKLHLLKPGILFFLLFQNASAQWQITAGPPQGNVKSLCNNDSTLFAATANVSPAVELSNNNGNSWLFAGLSNANSIVTKDSVVFAGGDLGVYQSPNNGANWNNTSSGLPSYPINCLAVSGSNIYAGTNGVYKSINNGLIWNKINLSWNGGVYAIAVSHDTILAGTLSSGIYMSTNGGSTWNTINTGLPLQVNAIFIYGSTYFAGTNNGLYISTNYGANWTISNVTNAIGCFARIGDNIFAGSYIGGGVFQSINGGLIWSQINTGLLNSNLNVFALAFNKTYLFAGTSGYVFRRLLSDLIINTPSVAPISIKATSTSICKNKSTTLSVNGGSLGTGASWHWYSNSCGGTPVGVGPTITVTPLVNTTYYVRAEGTANTTTCKQKTITVLPLPTATVTPNSPITICQGGSVVLNASTGVGFTYKWKLNNINIPGAVNSSYTTSSPGNYTVIVTNSGGCSAKSSPANVAVSSLPVATITANGSTTFCGNNNVVLVSSFASTYQWYKNNVLISGATFQTYTATATAKYSVQVANASNCTASSSQIQVTKNVLPSVVLTTSGPTTFCNGDSVVITSTTNALNPTFQWYKNFVLIPGASTSLFAAKASGKYYVVTTNTNTGCTKVSSNVSVTVNCKTANDEIASNLLSIYPNPTTDLVNLVFNTDQENSGNIEIYNTLGKLIYSKSIDIISGENYQLIDLTNAVKGIYFLQLKTDVQTYNLKIIKE